MLPLDKHLSAWKLKIVSSHGKPDRTRSRRLVRKGVTAALEAGRQAGKKRERITLSSVAYPHGIGVPDSRSSPQPAGARTEDEVPVSGRERA